MTAATSPEARTQIVNLVRGGHLELTLVPGLHALREEVTLVVQRAVGLGDHVLLLLIRGQVYDLGRDERLDLHGGLAEAGDPLGGVLG